MAMMKPPPSCQPPTPAIRQLSRWRLCASQGNSRRATSSPSLGQRSHIYSDTQVTALIIRQQLLVRTLIRVHGRRRRYCSCKMPSTRARRQAVNPCRVGPGRVLRLTTRSACDVTTHSLNWDLRIIDQLLVRQRREAIVVIALVLKAGMLARDMFGFSTEDGGMPVWSRPIRWNLSATSPCKLASNWCRKHLHAACP